jgi:hypothetical protein
MSGYLQRLASSVRNPVGAIHPLVGSLYSPPKPEIAPLVEEESVVKTPIARPQPPASDTAAVAPERAERKPVEPLPKPREPEPAAEHTYVPLIEEPGDRWVKVAALQPAPAANADAEPWPPGRGQAARATRILKPTLPPRVAPRRATPPGEPNEIHDEIQIHIGRIEVTAAPPPARLPAPQPRKSLNLGEYLKRGRGRAS